MASPSDDTPQRIRRNKATAICNAVKFYEPPPCSSTSFSLTPQDWLTIAQTLWTKTPQDPAPDKPMSLERWLTHTYEGLADMTFESWRCF